MRVELDRRILLGGLLAAAAGCWIHGRLWTGLRLEDALITYRYAANLAEGSGFVFNAGERVLGTTTPLLTLALGLAGWLFGPERIPLLSNILMMTAGAGAGLFTFLTLERLGVRSPPALFVTAVFLFHPAVVWTTVGGMETPMVLLWMAAGAWAAARGASTMAGAFGGLLVLTRIDGVIWALGIQAVLLLRGRRAFLRSAIAGLLVILPWVVFAVWYFGSPVPHSVIAKRAIGPDYDPMSAEYLRAFLGWAVPFLAASSPFGTASGVLFFLVGAVALARHGDPIGWLLVLFPFLFAGAFYAGRTPLYFEWYLVPIAWCAILVGGLGLVAIARSARRVVSRFTPSPWPLSLLVAIACVGIFAQIGANIRSTGASHRDYQVNEETTRRAIGEWLAENTPPDAVVAMEAVGYQAYYSGRRVIDMAGLVSPEVVAIRKGSWSNAEMFHRILRDLQPDYLVLRSLEVDRNIHYHGGKLFETAEHMAYFAAHYREAARFEAPIERVWGADGFLTIYRREDLRKAEAANPLIYMALYHIARTTPMLEAGSCRFSIDGRPFRGIK